MFGSPCWLWTEIADRVPSTDFWTLNSRCPWLAASVDSLSLAFKVGEEAAEGIPSIPSNPFSRIPMEGRRFCSFLAQRDLSVHSAGKFSYLDSPVWSSLEWPSEEESDNNWNSNWKRWLEIQRMSWKTQNSKMSEIKFLVKRSARNMNFGLTTT